MISPIRHCDSRLSFIFQEKVLFHKAFHLESDQKISGTSETLTMQIIFYFLTFLKHVHSIFQGRGSEVNLSKFVFK